MNLYSFVSNSAPNLIDALGEITLVESIVGGVVVIIIADQFVEMYKEESTLKLQESGLCDLVRKRMALSGRRRGSLPAKIVRYEGMRIPFKGKRMIEVETELSYACLCANARMILVVYRQEDGTYENLRCRGLGLCQ